MILHDEELVSRLQSVITQPSNSSVLPLPEEMSAPFRFGFVDDDTTEDNTTRDDDGHEVTNSSAEEKSPAGAMPCLHTLDELVILSSA